MQDSIGALARRATEAPELVARPIMRRGASGMLRPFAARGAPTAASFGSYAARWTVRAVTPTHVPSGSVCARYRATYAALARAKNAPAKSRVELSSDKCVEALPRSRLVIWTRTSDALGVPKALLSEWIWLCGTVRPPSYRYRDPGSSAARRTPATFFSVTGRPSLSRGSDRKVGLPSSHYSAWASATIAADDDAASRRLMSLVPHPPATPSPRCSNRR